MRDIRKLMNIVEGAGDDQLIQKITQNIATLTANGYDFPMIADALSKSGIKAQILSPEQVSALESDALHEGLGQIGRYVANGISVLLLAAGIGVGATILVQATTISSTVGGMLLTIGSLGAMEKPFDQLMRNLGFGRDQRDQRDQRYDEAQSQRAEMDALCRQDAAGCQRVSDGLNNIDHIADTTSDDISGKHDFSNGLTWAKKEWLRKNTRPGTAARKYGELWIKSQ